MGRRLRFRRVMLACYTRDSGVSEGNACRLVFLGHSECRCLSVASAQGLHALLQSLPRFIGQRPCDCPTRVSCAERGGHGSRISKLGVYLDKLNGLAWALCARERCGKPFRIGGHRNKIYCSSACAEVQAQTAYLAKKKREQEEMAAKTAKKSVRRK